MRSLLMLILLAGSVGADEGLWVEHAPGGAVDESNPSGTDKLAFWERFHQEGIGQFLNEVEVPIDGGVGLDGVGELKARYRRWLTRMPGGSQAIVDQATLAIELKRAFPLATIGGVGISAAPFARLDGESFVMRPIPGGDSWDRIKRLLNVIDAKTTLPLRSDRLSSMLVGELWRLPLTVTVGGGIYAEGVWHPMKVWVTIGSSARGRTSVTLLRLSESELRFRLRMDQALIRDAHGGLVASIDAGLLGLPEAEGALGRLVDKQAVKALNRYLKASFSLSSHFENGSASIVEFVLDPRDPAQMKELARVLAGDLGALNNLTRLFRTGTVVQNPEKARSDLARLAAVRADAIGRHAAYVGSDNYRRKWRGWDLNVPVFFKAEGGESRASDRIVSAGGGRLSIFRADSRQRSEALSLPLLGVAHRQQRERSLSAYARPGQPAQALYIEQEGFKAQDERRGFALARRADALLRLAGAQRGLADPRSGLPLSRVWPGLENEAPPRGVNDREPVYERGQAAFTLALSPRAMSDAANASPFMVLRAYAATLSSSARAALEWIAANGNVSARGIFWRAPLLQRGLRSDFRWDRRDAGRSLGEVRHHVAVAWALICDLARVRAAANSEETARAFVSTMSGGRSGLSYDRALQVVLQLVDPADLSAEFFSDVKKNNGRARATRLTLRAEKNDPGLEAATRERARFAPYSRYAD